jgi:dGTP triphosphohydrolase
MASVTALRKPSALSPQRTALAEKIALRDAADREESALEAALAWDGAASQGIRDAELALKDAESAVEQAKADAAANVVSTTLGHALTSATSIKQARSNQLEAQDQLDAAIAAKAAVAARLLEVRARRTPDFVIRDAAIMVLRAEAAEMISDLAAQCQQAQRTLLGAGLALNWLAGDVIERGVVPGVHGHDAILNRDVDAALLRFRSLPESWDWMRDRSMRTDIVWADTLTSLMTDASAPLST